MTQNTLKQATDEDCNEVLADTAAQAATKKRYSDKFIEILGGLND